MTNLEELVQEINRFEAIISEWDESQRCVAVGLKRAIEALHKAALTNLIKSLKQESMPALRHAVADELVYAVLLYHELVKPPKPLLSQRIQTALEEVRPGLKSHNGDVEIVAIKPPDTVEVRLIGTCSSCPASTLTLSQGVEQAIKNHCPEITKVVAVANNFTVNNVNSGLISPFSSKITSTWIKVATIDQVPEFSVLAVQLAGTSLILHRQGITVKSYRNACTHLGSPLEKGKVENGIITCPAHGFQYKLETGKCLTVPDVSLQSYPVKVKDDKVFVKLQK
ncbi:Rieske [2Fe-2S] domain-containing protein [Nostoc commune NIES-4072]|uniref:Rieske [2Fe-2S] domain-containing protein n=1 Tax=Nostoc commune NIES-4072 TaxID=2005467 RepID=A0A2R5FUW7_NOSCO|nr:NifU family protein [Nostoc commune]BBD66467.1 Rieske [2Fe-2S] domain-containing protein [Nostoc commune HK-02]GBG22552.1 Rieske [2Fe-2S] domain-containing protein [Nostoc commune NIES-4072]